MAGQTAILHTDRNREYAKTLIDAAPDGAIVTVSDAKEARTKQQNRTLHMWFGEIARHQADLDATEVKGMCHRRWGLTIRLRSKEFSWLWDRSGKNLPYEQQCKLLASGLLNVSSGMTVDELSEYMDAMYRHFRDDGVPLTDPDAKKYAGEMA